MIADRRAAAVARWLCTHDVVFCAACEEQARAMLVVADLAAAAGCPGCMDECRDIAFERRWTTEAAATIGVDADRLTDFAELRAGRAPVRDLMSRNFLREALEELADARNYLVWHAEQNARVNASHDIAGEISEATAQALAATALAFHHAERARGLVMGSA